MSWPIGIASALICLVVHADAALADTVLVLSQTGAQLTAIDSTTDRVVGGLALAPAPAGLAIVPQSALAFVTHPDARLISSVDLASWQVKGTFAVTGTPFGIAAGRNGKVYFGDWNGDRVQEMDAKTGTVTRSVKAGHAPAQLALLPDETLLLAVGRESDTVTAIETEGLSEKATLKVGRAPFALAVAGDGKRAVVANAQGGTVSVIDVASLKVVATERVGAMPYGVALEPNGDVLVANQQSGTVSMLESGKTEAAAIKVGSYPEGVAVTADGRKAYVANWFSDDVSVIDLETRREIARIKCAGGPRAVAIVRGSYGR